MPQDTPSVGRHFFSAVRKTLSLQRILLSRVVGYVPAFILLLSVVLSGVISGLSTPQTVYAQTPNTTLNFQARILNLSGSLVPDGDYHIEFKIYDTVSSGGTAQGACSGNCLWMETRTGGDVIRVVNGYVSVNLGSVTSFPSNMPWGNNLYITMRVGGAGGSPSWDTQEMTNATNRMKMSVAPVAFVANNVASGSTNSASTNSSTISIQSGNALGTTSNSGNITIDSGTATGTTGTVVLGATNASALTIGRAGVTTTLQGSVALTGAGTALTVTNNAVFNGDITLGNASADTLTVNANANFTGNLSVTTGDTFTNAGSSVYTALAISDIAGGGAIGTAAATVDGATTFNIAQTTASQALTLPAPTVTTAGRIVYVNNVGSASFTMYGTTIATNGSNAFIWNGTQWITTVSLSGSSVSVVGTIDSQTKSADGAVILGNAIYLQTADVSNVGVVSIGSQTFNGVKTFDDGVVITAGGLTVTAGTLTVGGSTVNSTLALGNFASGGSIGSAATTVDIYTSISVSQTTSAQTLTIPTPTASTTYGRTVQLSNVGTASFTVLGNVLAPGTSLTAIWSNTSGGASWQTSGTAKSGGAARTVGTSASGGASSAVASTNPSSADFINTSTTSAQTVINTALTAVGASGGGTVVLMEGTYIIDGSVSIPNNTTLSGVGLGTIIKFKNGINASFNGIVNTDTVTGTKVGVQNLRIEGNKANQSGGSVGMFGIRFVGVGSSSRDGGRINGLEIQNVYGTAPGGGAAVLLEDSDNNSILSITASNNSRDGFWSTGTSAGNSFYSNVANNNRNGFYLNGNGGDSVNSNSTSGNTVAGIWLDAFNSVANGNISRSDAVGIVNSGSINNITANNILSSTSYGIEITGGNNNVVGNTVYNAGSTNNNAIYVSGDYNSISSNYLGDGSCATTCFGINIASGSKNSLEGNRITGSLVTSASINDSGTNTIYINQQTNSTDYTAEVTDFRFRGSANSATAFAIQNASGTSVFNVNTSTVGATVTGTLTVSGANATSLGGTLAVTGTSTFTGLTTLNGGLTVETGDTFTFNGDAFTDFTGGGLVNSSGVLTVDATTATGFFQNAGNSFGAVGTIGTNDAFGLSVETNNTVRASFANSNILYLGNADSATGLAASPNAFSVLGTSNSTATGAGGAVTLQAGAGNTSGTGGLTTVNGGVAGATGVGGGVTIRAGAGGATSGAGGAITISSGAGTAGNSNSGAITISTASGTGTNTSGSINLSVGQGLSQGSINLSTAQFGGLYGNFNIGAVGGRTQLGTATTNAKLSVVNVGSVYDTDSVILGQSSATQTGNLLTLRNSGLTNLFVVDINGNTSVAGTQTISGNLTVDTNTLFVNSASDFVNIGSTTDELAKFAIVGSADEEQLLIRAAAGQTVANPLVLLQNSSSAELARINASTTSLYFGNAAGGNSAAGVNNTGIGASALGSVLTGTGNTTLGSGALASVSVNNNNTAVGYNAGNLATGGNNIFLGALAGDNVTTGTDNIIIGYNLDASAAGVSNELRIGGVLQGNTSTLATQFNGALTVVGNTVASANLTVGTGAGVGLFTNNGATVNTTLALGNFASGGSIGSAATTVDIYTSISVAQTTTAQTLTLSTPTASTTYGRTVFIGNVGTASFTFLNNVIAPGTSIAAIWSNTDGGASWQTSGTAKSGGTGATVSTTATGGASSAVASKNPYGADYVNSSTTSAQTTINTALTAVGSSGGGTVNLMEGTYIIDGSISIPNNVTLSGSGSGTIIKFKNGINANFSGIVNTDTSTGTNVNVTALTIDGNKANQSGAAVRMSGVFYSNVGSVSPAREGGRISNLNVNNVFAGASSGYTRGGIATDFSSYVTITSNTVTDNVASGIFVANSVGAQSNVISNNIARNSRNGIRDASYYTTVSGNTTSNNTQYGILSEGGQGAISNNTSTADAVGIRASNSGSVIGNNVSNSTSYGIYAVGSANIITGNYLNDTGGSTTTDGIYDISGYNNISDNYIYDTTCSVTCYSINLASGGLGKTSLSNNRFNGTINDAATGTIYVNQSTNNGSSLDVSDFRFRGNVNSTTAFAFQNAAGTTVLNVNTSTVGVTVTGTLTASDLLRAGTGGTPGVATAAGDLYVQDALEVDGVLNAAGAATFGSTLAVQGASITIGTSSTTNGLVTLLNSTNAFGVTISASAQTTGSATISIPNTSGVADTFCLQTINNCPGNSKFTDGGTFNYLTQNTDDLVIGGTASYSAKLAVIGDANETQLLIRANSTQAYPLVLFQDSAGSDLANLSVTSDQNYIFGLAAASNLDAGSQYNIAIGTNALAFSDISNNNVAIGRTALQNIESDGNIGIGESVFGPVTTGSKNTGVGNSVGLFAATGNSNNSVFGYRSFYGNDGTDNAIFGTEAVSSVNFSTNNNNTIFGTRAGRIFAGSSNNILLGYQAGDNITAGSNNIIIGYDLDASSATVSNELRIGGVLQGNTSTLAAQFNGTLAVATLGSADTSTFLCRNTSNQLATCSSTPLTNSLTDNIADSFDLQEGTNNYVNINTTNASENISFGNATTNPSYSFLGSGTLTVTGNTVLVGDLAVNGDDITSDGDLTITPAGGDTNIVGRLAVSGSTGGAYSTLASFVSTTTSVGTDALGTYTELTASPGSASTAGYYGAKIVATSASSNLTLNGDLTGLNASGQYTGIGTIDQLGGAWLYGENTSTGTVNRGYGLYVDAPYNTGAGTIIYSQGIFVSNTTSGTNNANLILGSSNPTGNWSIYNNSAYNNYFAGNFGIGQATAATIDGNALVVNNQATTDNILLLQDNGSAVLTVADGGAITATQLVTLNGGLTLETGDTLTFNGDAFTDFTGGGLVNTGGVLTVDTTSATGYFRNGGNAFTANSTLGNTGNFDLNLLTNNLTRATLQADGDLAVDTNTLFVDAAGDRVGIGNTGSTGKLSVSGATSALALFESTGANNAYVSINAPTGQQSGINLNTNSTNRYQIGVQTDNSFFLYDNANTRDAVNITTTGNILLNRSGGNVGIGNASAPNRLSINTLTVADSTAQIAVSTGATTGKGVVIQRVASQTANPFEVQNESGVPIAYVAASGNIVTEGEFISPYGARSADGTGASTTFTVRTGNTTGGSGLSTGVLTLQSGNGSGTNTSSGNVVIDSGSVTGSGTAGTVVLGATNASAITLGRTGITTTNTGALTVTQLTTLNGGLTVEAGDNFTFNTDIFTDFTGGGLVNTGGVLSVDTTSATGFFRNGGNAFAGTATVGTTDANALAVVTGGTGRAVFTNGTTLYLGNSNTTGTAAAPSAFTVYGTSSSTAATAGGALTVSSGIGNTSGAGGLMTLQSGQGGSTGAGGAISLVTGAGGSTSGASGALNILTGNVTSGTAGNISIDVGTSTAGNGSILIGTAARSQTITLGNTTGGAFSARGSALTLRTNDGAVGGALNILSGAGTGGTGSGGVINLTSGNGDLGGQAITLTAGSSTTANSLTGSVFSLGAGNTLFATAGNVSLTGGTSGSIRTESGGAITLAGGVSNNTTGAGGAVTITGGNTTGAGPAGGAVVIDGGTSASGTPGAISVGVTNSRSITVGNTTGATALTLRVGTGNFSLDGVTNSAYTLGASTTTGTFTLGGTAQTGNITLGSSSGTSSVLIANGAGASTANIANATVAGATVNIAGGANTSANSVNIANGATAATTTVSILSGVGTASTASLLLANNTRVTTIDIGNIAAAAARTINLGTGSNTVGIDAINIGTGATTVAGGKTINIGSGTPTGSGSNLITIGSTALASTTTINAGTGLLNFGATQAQFTEVTGTRTLTVQTRTTNIAGSSLTIQAGSAGTGASAFTGGALTLQGGSAGGTGNANGGNVSLVGGTGTGTGVKGLVVIDTATFSAATVQNFTGNANITQANIDSLGSILISGDIAGRIATITDPTTTTAGRVIYVTNTGSVDITLAANTVGVALSLSLKPATTATMYWNGVDWTAAGASSSTDLQAAYNNTASSAGAAELVLKNTSTSNGLTVRNGTSTDEITGGLFEVQTSIGSNIFTVNNNAVEYATNGGAETAGGTAATFPATTWDTTTGGTVDRYNSTTGGYDANNVGTGQASVRMVTTTTNHGARNRISTSLTSGLTYTVSFAVRGATNFATLQTLYSPDGTTTGTTTCATAQTVTSGQWSRISCTFIASGTITSSNSILIRQTDATGRTFYIDNLSVNVNASANFAGDGTADNAGTFATNWGDYEAGAAVTVAQETSVIYEGSASARAIITPATANVGIRNNMAITPAISTQFLVSFYARSTTTVTGALAVGFLPAGGTGLPSGTAGCVDYNTQSLVANAWTKITCLFTTPGSGISNPDLVIYQTDTAARTIYVDALSITLNTNNSNNVQIGGGNKGGPATLFTLDRSASAPIADNNDAYLGSMYYNTTTGRIQCYEADGWGACGAAPDNIVNLNPEYAGAVLNGTGVGTMTADFCAEQAGVLNVNTALCASGEAKNFYKWTSPQATQQTYSIYVTYQLPATFNGFSSDDTVQLVALTDSANATVSYEMYKSTGSAVTACGTETTVSTGVQTLWQTAGINGNESTGCSFNSASASNFVIFKINMKANSNASAYVSTLSFTTTGR